MEHIMKLNPDPFHKIKDGIKTIELRLYDEKRKLISVGDSITFINTDNEEDSICVDVKDIYIFDSFETLYKELPLLECGYTKENVDKASASDMEAYYSKEKQSQYGVVGIRVKLR